jgi:hypothetical protein
LSGLSFEDNPYLYYMEGKLCRNLRWYNTLVRTFYVLMKLAEVSVGSRQKSEYLV